MNADKISKLISDKNERIEAAVVRGAQHLIESIVNEQAEIAAGNKRIAELRATLKALEVVPVDPKAILGE